VHARGDAAPRREVVAVGASAGGVEALVRLVQILPDDFPATLLVVLHVSPRGTSVLPDILARAGALPAAHAVDGEEIEPGKIIVGPPDHHLIVEPGRVRLVRGPRQNGHRPAIDSLFESAAQAYGPCLIGVLLSGVLDDGSVGLLRIKSGGGATVVQDPEDALYPAMPRNAIQHVNPDLVLAAAEIPEALEMLVREPVETRDFELIQSLVGDPARPDPAWNASYEPSGATCPECGGPLWETDAEGLPVYACRVGHKYTPQALLAHHSDSVEAALRGGVRALEERAALARRLATSLRDRGSLRSAERIEERATQADAHGSAIRQVLQETASLVPDEEATALMDPAADGEGRR
jgi:two-component system chemotaxis response regulator CheB